MHLFSQVDSIQCKPHYLLLACLMMSCNAAAEVHQCKQSNGVVSFQNLPCQSDPSADPAVASDPDSCPPLAWLPPKTDGDCGDVKLIRYESTYKMPVAGSQDDAGSAATIADDTCADIVFFLCDSAGNDWKTDQLAPRFVMKLNGGSVLEGHWMRVRNPDSNNRVYESEICFGCPDCQLGTIVDIACR